VLNRIIHHLNKASREDLHTEMRERLRTSGG
jgi:hypothetical protein